MKELAEQLAKFTASWTASCWDEIDWMTRIKEVQLREIVDNRRKEATAAQASKSLQCPQFIKHVSWHGQGAYLPLKKASSQCVMTNG